MSVMLLHQPQATKQQEGRCWWLLQEAVTDQGLGRSCNTQKRGLGHRDTKHTGNCSQIIQEHTVGSCDSVDSREQLAPGHPDILQQSRTSTW